MQLNMPEINVHEAEPANFYIQGKAMRCSGLFSLGCASRPGQTDSIQERVDPVD